MKKRLLAFLLVLVMVVGFVPITARAEGIPVNSIEDDPLAGFVFNVSESITWHISEDLSLVLQDDGQYFLYIPTFAVQNYTVTLSIKAPDSFTDTFTIDYTAYNATGRTQTPKTVSSVDGSISLTDYYARATSTSIFLSNLVLKKGEDQFSIILKPYSYLTRLFVHQTDNQTVTKIDDTTYVSQVAPGEEVRIQAKGGVDSSRLTKCTFYFNGEPAENGIFTITPGNESPIDLAIRLVDAASYGIEERTYHLILTVQENAYPILNNYTSDTTLRAEKDEELIISVLADAVDENTVYTWYKDGVIVDQENSSSIQVDTSIPTKYMYQCTVTNTSNGSEYSVQTGLITVWVHASEIDPPVFLVQPESAEYSAGETAQTLTADVNRLTSYIYTFQWYKALSADAYNGVAVGEPVTITHGMVNTATYTPVTNTIGSQWYYCEVIAQYAYYNENHENVYIISQPAYSDFAEIKVTPAELTLDGTGTVEDPFLIKTYSDLKLLRDCVAVGSSFEGLYFKMASDIATEADWTPIGITLDGTNKVNVAGNLRAFKGVFDGGGHTLTVASGGLPLFGYVQNTTIQNLKLYGPQINGYGLVNNFYGYGLSGTGVTIDGVTILSGTNILKSGLLGGEIDTSINGFAGVSAEFEANISNCTIQSGVTIGTAGTQNYIGSFAGRFQGTIENCVSYATVKGKNYVGGIIGTRDNAMGNCKVINCQFHGTVQASGDNVGGIVGGGYSNSTAPNGVKVTVKNCLVDGSVTGVKNVGGILGGDNYVAQAWNDYTFASNSFTGRISGSENVGGVIGFYDSLNSVDNVINNTYASGCGASKGIGKVVYVDTSCETHETASGAIYFNTQTSISGCPDVLGCHWQVGLNRTDDPLGADAYRLTGDSAPAPFVVELTITGYKEQYMVGDTALDTTNMVITATMSDGTTQDVAIADAEFTGFDSSTPGQKTITVAFGGVTATFTIMVSAPAGETINVKLTVLGDTHHEMSEGSHGLWLGGLTTWLPETQYTVSANATVWDLINQAFDADDTLTVESRFTQQYNSQYIFAVTKDGVRLEEKDDGRTNSGWMYALNGEHVQVGVSNQHLADGDAVILHWCDDYQADEAAAGQQQQDKQAAMAVEALIDAIGTPVTLESETAITAARTAYDALNDNAKSYVDPDCYAILTAAEATLAELKASAQRVADVIAAINALPAADELTLNDETAVAAARAAFDALSETEQAQVTNLAALEAAEAKIDQLEAEQDQQAASAADQVIAALPAVDAITLDDAAAVAEARAAYDALTPEQQALVNNYDALLAAEAKIAELQEQAASAQRVAEANAAIDALPAADEVTLADEAAVIAARMAYDALSDAEKAQVSADKLIAAEAKIAELKAQQSSEEKINDATDKINAIPAADAVTLADEAAIAAARAAYDALTDAEKAQVDASALVAAEAKLAALKFAALKPEVKTANAKNGKIELTITPVAGAVKYKIFVSDKADGTYKEAATVTDVKYTYNGTPGQQYFFKVVAVNAAGVESAESAVVSQFRLPAQVTSLKVKSKKKKEVTLTWKKVTGAKKYVIYMSKNGKTGWKKIGTVKTNKFTYKKAPAGKKMYFRVQAITANGKKGEFSKAVSVKVKK